MATQTVHTQVREGAAAFIDMMKKVNALTEADLERFSEVSETGRDVRDYRAVAGVVGAALRHNVFEADAAHAQGFLRAFADLICINVDGSGCDARDNWDPISTTAAAYGDAMEVRNA